MAKEPKDPADAKPADIQHKDAEPVATIKETKQGLTADHAEKIARSRRN